MALKIRWLDQALAANKGVGPGFHFLRHALAIVILAHHCRVAVFGLGLNAGVAGYVKGAPFYRQLAAHLSPGLLFIELSRPALFALVGVFFALSGFLVYGSATRLRNIGSFFANRALRLLPALTVEVFLSALILGPLVTELPLGTYFSEPQFFRYFGNIVGEVTFTLPGVFLRNPWPDMVNANLWTLPPELGCYLLMLAMMATGLTGRKRLMGAMVLVAVAALQVCEIVAPDALPVRADSTHFTAFFIVFLFVAGAAFFANADLVPLHPILFVGAGSVYWLLMLTGVLQFLGGVLLTYCMVVIGMTRFGWFDRLVKLDLSYGIYLYGFPITQGMIFALHPFLKGLARPGEYAIIFTLVVGATALFATASWVYVEKPALGLRRRLGTRPLKIPEQQQTLTAVTAISPYATGPGAVKVANAGESA